MTFEQWLIKQKHRNSPLGDLARDYIDCNQDKPIEKTKHWWRAPPEVEEVLKKARRQFKRYLKGL